MMGGKIGVQSVPGEGSTFRFTARLDRRDSPPVRGAPRSLSLRGLRILVAAADTAGRAILHRQIEGWGVRNGTTEDGPRALEMLIQAAESGQPYQAAILDAAISGMTWIELARAIRADARIAGIALIVLTPGPEPTEESGSLGIRAYLKKPVRQSQLYNVLTSLGNRSAPSADAKGVSADVQINRGRYSSYRVLLVEDNPVNQAVSKAMLEYFGCRTDVAANGREALKALAVTPYDLILMDCQMPVMDGYEATRVIRQQEAAGGGTPRVHIPIIALTAHAMEGDREECLKAGMDDYLSKPFKPEEIDVILGKWLTSPSGNGEVKRREVPPRPDAGASA